MNQRVMDFKLGSTCFFIIMIIHRYSQPITINHYNFQRLLRYESFMY
jgi:hypothetical protein